MNFIFLIISFFSLFSIHASELTQSTSPSFSDFDMVRFFKYPDEDEIMMTITNESDGTTETMSVPVDFFEGIELDKPNQEELALKVTKLKEEVAFKQKILKEYEADLKLKKETAIGTIPPCPPEPYTQLPTDKTRGSVFTELLAMRIQLKPIKDPHPAQTEHEEDDNLDLQESLRRALVEKFSKALPDRGRDASPTDSVSDSE